MQAQFLLDSHIKDKTTIICGHRGGAGPHEPENTMRAFRWAFDNKLTAIEFDLWLTEDDKLVIIHGGDDGEMPESGNQYIYNLTYDQIQYYHKLSQVWPKEPEKQTVDSEVPLVSDLLQEIKDKNHDIILLFEVKVPRNSNLKKVYNWERCLDLLNIMIKEF